MADKHISETHYFSLKEMVKSYAQSKWLYINRAFGRDCHYRIIDGDIDAGTAAGKKAGTGSGLSGEPAPVGAAVCDTGRG